jgi:hypothetical protein
MRRVQRIRTSTWVLIAIFAVTLLVYLWVKPGPKAASSPSSGTGTTTPATVAPTTSAPTVTPTSPSPTISSPQPSRKASPTVGATPTSSPSSVVSPVPSATIPASP